MQHDQLEKQLQGKEKIHNNLYSVQIGHTANSTSDLKCCTAFADCWLQNIDFIELDCILKYSHFHSRELTWNRLTWILFTLIRPLLRPKCSPQVCKYHTLEFEITVLLKNHFRKPKKQLLHCLSLWALIFLLGLLFLICSCVLVHEDRTLWTLNWKPLRNIWRKHVNKTK